MFLVIRCIIRFTVLLVGDTMQMQPFSSNQDYSDSTKDFWSNISEPWRLAIQQAWLAYRNGSFPIGAVITNIQGKILSQGRNALDDNSEPKNPLMNHFMAHAEVNAFIDLGGQKKLYINKSDDEYVLYTTLEPCIMCAGVTALSNVRIVHFLLPDIHRGASDVFQTLPRIKSKGILAHGPYPGSIGNVMMAILIEKMLHIGTEIPNEDFIQQFMPGFFEGVSFGQKMYRNGYLRRCISDNLLINVIFNDIALQMNNG